MRILPPVAALLVGVSAVSADPLPSWQETDTKTAIIDFVEAVTDPDSQDFVPRADRIAAFDNDGTLWSEQPAYFQLLYALDVLKDKAEADPDILSSDALKAANDGDMAGLMASGKDGLIELLNVSHSGLSVDDFMADSRDWLLSTNHPQTGIPFAQMTYQPMVELLRYLRDEGFETYIVSGGGVHFIRAVSDDAYGIPSQNVVGSEGTTVYDVVEGKGTLMKQGGVFFIDDKAGKPVGIDRYIGKRPVLAVGNSDGDFAMLEYATQGDGLRMGVLIHHTDAEREFAYDREGHIGVLDQGLDEAVDRGWLVVDMAKDWSRVWTGQQ
ncbi:HAD family hydrolase [Paracoccus sp. Z330]|uniref:HAD family hydrolase n=1 Tax=Paracoccus onchidii TaxID=3017813 RepID=A0ABT4ZHA3_9RHOB|nr:HAD family hydrolase [Paracoccus onchidii]MDB6178358.1 HAD family hydrolase [Paracoccus onchidii]